MKAVRYKGPSPITHPDSLVDIDLPTPVSGGRDLLVEVRAVSVNPVDVKLRASAAPLKGDTYRVLGFDASGVVREAGPQATRADALVERWFSPDSSDGTCASFRLSSQHARSTRGLIPPSGCVCLAAQWWWCVSKSGIPAANHAPATLRMRSTGLAHSEGAGVSTSSI
jgi:NADPH:quinone reductase-like Zn-dependent oxidoreductase